ncbi:GH25 family lysozyme M1 (1,4-beta-N-acetylmuramidase) [Saccharopolyspora erythraea NRRL 2338]|uniref:GH25 family lysozyme M1 (1,4-beta-N-acetylmuramidase) n=1 Tax=Saccharopolyspora erythraea TaxID=1836 RepID=A0ABN1EA80_SACER|nr:lysozyme [Saccharopolyspora erythraea]EQD82917.1 glycoside hydrolase [Saccharopolyspora erythraea D]PFG98221.1 GH25 family lysozyme M1 (1,4-beta-N-acetylmuramidase) [Saccharopolyspora erythraea NRRL 2338]
MRPESPDQSRNPETPDTSNETQDRGLRSTALKADHAVRSAVDQVRPVVHRIGESPAAQRVRQWLAPLLLRIQQWIAPLARRLWERVAPQVEAAQDKVQGRLNSAFGNDLTAGKQSPVPARVRSMQLGAAAAALGIVAVVVGSAGGVSGGQDVEEAAQTAALPAGAPQNPGQAPVPADPHGGDGDVPPEAPPAPEPEAPWGPPAEGIDVSNHNGSIDWRKVAADGKQFTFVLATDGTSFTNPRYSEQYHGAKEAGLIAGAYHFARPDKSAEAQADRLLATADYQPDGRSLPPVLDLEVDPKGGGCYGLSVQEMHQWTDTFNRKIKDATGKDPIIYANPSFWNQCMGGTADYGDHPLWLASYGVSNPKVPAGFDNWDFWQYTDSGKVAGISKPTDLNQFQGGIERLKQLASN